MHISDLFLLSSVASETLNYQEQFSNHRDTPAHDRDKGCSLKKTRDCCYLPDFPVSWLLWPPAVVTQIGFRNALTQKRGFTAVPFLSTGWHGSSSRRFSSELPHNDHTSPISSQLMIENLATIACWLPMFLWNQQWLIPSTVQFVKLRQAPSLHFCSVISFAIPSSWTQCFRQY